MEDWHSTNGTRVHRDGTVIEVAPRSPVSLRTGDALELGDFVLAVEVPR